MKPVLTILEIHKKLVSMDDNQIVEAAERARFPRRSSLPADALRIAMISSIMEGTSTFDPILLNRIHEAIR